jgi:hypothetical protein
VVGSAALLLNGLHHGSLLLLCLLAGLPFLLVLDLFPGRHLFRLLHHDLLHLLATAQSRSLQHLCHFLALTDLKPDVGLT